MDNLSPSPNLSFSGREFERTQFHAKSFPIGQVRAAVQTYGPAPVSQDATFHWADLQVIGQINQTYMVAQSHEAMYLVDQHAAHERVVFERLMEAFRLGKIEIQNLLMPLVFDFSAAEVETLLRHREAIEKLGLLLERMGPESIAVQAIPSLVAESSVSDALQRLAFELSENLGELAWEKTVAELCASMACHSVIRAGQAQSREEMHDLLKQMDCYPLSSFCPHGRPVFVKRRFAEIDREFGRIV
jgi:DNA mismatch repair protein MutL